LLQYNRVAAVVNPTKNKTMRFMSTVNFNVN